MAMIQCRVCGKEISDQAKKCPYCGRKSNNKKYRLKSGQRIAIIIAIIFFICLSVIGGNFCYRYYIVPMNHYKKAEAFLVDEQFEKAIKEFRYAGKYKDSMERIQETKYKWANKADIDKAIELYDDLGDYKDSKNKLANAKKEKARQNALESLQNACNKCNSNRVKLSSDKKSIMVDSIDQYDFLTMLDIQTIIEELGLPDSLYDEMCYTNALMGRQTEKFVYYEVSWSYHPDNGLDVIFKFLY